MATRLRDEGVLLGLLPPESMCTRGAFRPRPDDNVPPFPDGHATETAVMLGWTGGRQWPAFTASPEANDGQPHALDRWSRRLIDGAAAVLDAMALYPFGGPPHHDFQRWALRAEPVARSPIGLLIHPDWGLWHAYRGALALRQRLPLIETAAAASPCDACAQRPCLSACPADAFSPDTGYHVAACIRHLRDPAGAACLTTGCAARRACPVGRQHAHAPAQSLFHMQAFLRACSNLDTR